MLLEAEVSTAFIKAIRLLNNFRKCIIIFSTLQEFGAKIINFLAKKLSILTFKIARCPAERQLKSALCGRLAGRLCR